MLNAVIFLLTTIDVITALLLIGIILIQQSKSGGGLTAMGGGMTESVFGAAAGNVLTRGTVTLASVFLGITLVLAVITGHRGPRRSVGESLGPKKPGIEEKAGKGVDEAVPAKSGTGAENDAGTTPASPVGGKAEQE